jgi:sigma-B regulation protein RsbU (phosphoserine phosphatase)
MRKGYREFLGRIGWTEKTFLVLLAIYAVLRLIGQSPTWQFLTALAAFVFGSIVLVRLTYSVTRKAIWRLRNRLIVSYLFIAVVPIVLIVLLAGLAGYTLIGQVAAYFVRTDLANRETQVFRQAEQAAGIMPGRGGRGGFGARGPGPNSSGPSNDAGGRGYYGSGRAFVPGGGFPGLGRGADGRAGSAQAGRAFVPPTPGAPGSSESAYFFDQQGNMAQSRFTGSEVLIKTTKDLKFPADAKITSPPLDWSAQASGLIYKKDEAGNKRFYLWAHVVPTSGEVREVDILWPLTSEMLAGLERRLSNVAILDRDGPPYVPAAPGTQVPKAANWFDFPVGGLYPLQISSWDSPDDQHQIDALLAVNSRVSAVLGIIFEQRPGQRFEFNGALEEFFIGLAALFLFVEIGSLWIGAKLTRSMTGAVHEIYQGTQHVKEGDFSYRIAVKGDDQLAEMGASFNTMTENLGQLIVVAKEKERLQSELEIASEVQKQLFPRDVPSSKSLELKGICNPARVVSGDYYDFMTLPGSDVAFAIGDVAGKGISAALLMATIQSAMRTQLSATNGAGPPHFSAATLVSQLNRQLYNTTTPEKYATFFFAIYDEDLRALTFTNAGHLPPLLMRSGEFTKLNPTGTVVGAFPFAKYEEKTVQLEEGDIVVAYTDGIVEPENPYGEMFGEDRMKELILRYARAGSSEIIAKTMEAVNQWTGSSELQDDMTMIVARRV